MEISVDIDCDESIYLDKPLSENDEKIKGGPTMRRHGNESRALGKNGDDINENP